MYRGRQPQTLILCVYWSRLTRMHEMPVAKLMLVLARSSILAWTLAYVR